VRIVVKVPFSPFSPFFTTSHSEPLAEATLDTSAIELRALAVLDRFELDRSVRLPGVRAELEPP